MLRSFEGEARIGDVRWKAKEFINKCQCWGSVKQARRGQDMWSLQGEEWMPPRDVTAITLAVDSSISLVAE